MFALYLSHFAYFCIREIWGIISNTCSCVLSKGARGGLRGLARHRYIDPESPKAVDKTLVDSALVYSGEVFARRECLQLAEAGEQT